MVQHDHAEYVEGCFRCDLSADEVGDSARRLADAIDNVLTEIVTGVPREPPSTAAAANAYLASNLTLGHLERILEGIEDGRAADDADAFLALGEDKFRAFQALRNGGTLLIGGYRRGGSRGAAIYDQFTSAMPDVRCYLTEYLPDGVTYVISRNTWLLGGR